MTSQNQLPANDNERNELHWLLRVWACHYDPWPLPSDGKISCLFGIPCPNPFCPCTGAALPSSYYAQSLNRLLPQINAVAVGIAPNPFDRAICQEFATRTSWRRQGVLMVRATHETAPIWREYLKCEAPHADFMEAGR